MYKKFVGGNDLILEQSKDFLSIIDLIRIKETESFADWFCKVMCSLYGNFNDQTDNIPMLYYVTDD